MPVRASHRELTGESGTSGRGRRHSLGKAASSIGRFANCFRPWKKRPSVYVTTGSRISGAPSGAGYSGESEILDGDVPGTLTFSCNICGTSNRRPLAFIQREEPSCDGCGSTLRCRGVVHALSTSLFGRCLTIPNFPSCPDIVAWGLSDWHEYADRLSKKLSYTNTFYHQDPRLDITSISSRDIGRLDVLISSDVFEHVSPPVGKALKNARLLLKPNGVLILTVPYGLQPETVEHYPRLYDFVIEDYEGDRRLVNTTVDGERETFSNLVFHGGAGSTLEMRIFSKTGSWRTFRRQGSREWRFNPTHVSSTEFSGGSPGRCLSWPARKSLLRCGPRATG